MSALECQLKQLELNVAEQFGDLSDSDLSEGLPDECSDTDAPGDVAADNVADDDDGYDPLYCIACNKAFKSDKACVTSFKSINGF
jgi:DnaJ homolog subfamily A member 5